MISYRELGVKQQISGSGGDALPTFSNSLNNLSLVKELPHCPSITGLAQASHNINKGSLARLKPYLHTEIAKICPKNEWPVATQCDR